MAGPETTHLDYSVSRPWFLGLLPLPPSFRKATSLPKPPPLPQEARLQARWRPRSKLHRRRCRGGYNSSYQRPVDS